MAGNRNQINGNSAFSAGFDPNDAFFDDAPANEVAKALTVGDDIPVGDFTMTMTGLRFEGESIDRDTWLKFGTYLNTHKSAVQWMIGDWINLVDESTIEQWVTNEDMQSAGINPDVPNGRYQWIAEVTGYSYGYLINLKSVAERFTNSFRHESISFSHYTALYDKNLSDAKCLDWLEKIHQNGMSVSQLRRAINPSEKRKLPAVMDRTEKLVKNWRKSWNGLPQSDRLDVVTQLEALLEEMKNDLNQTP